MEIKWIKILQKSVLEIIYVLFTQFQPKYSIDKATTFNNNVSRTGNREIVRLKYDAMTYEIVGQS